MKLHIFSAIWALTIAVSGCTSVARIAGAEKVVPDEFKVVTKAPLVIPPEFSLRPPRPGESVPAYLDPEKSAELILFGENSGQAASTGEKALIALAGADVVNNNIRASVDYEAADILRKGTRFSDRVFNFGRNAEPAQDATVLDSAEEEQRLADLIESATGGGKVIIEKERKGARLPGL